MEYLCELYANGETSEVLRARFRDVVLLNNVDEVRRIWVKFPMAAWTFAMPDLMNELIKANAVEMIALFNDGRRVLEIPPSAPKIIVIAHEDYNVASMLLNTTLSFLARSPINISNLRLSNMMISLLENLDFKVALRLREIVTEKHGWSSDSRQFLSGHVDIRKLANDLLDMKNDMYTP